VHVPEHRCAALLATTDAAFSGIAACIDPATGAATVIEPPTPQQGASPLRAAMTLG
jgi:hypothetical protein